MADFKKKVEATGHKIAEGAAKVGHKLSEGTEKAADWVKEKAHEVGHRVDEAAQKVGHAAQSATTPHGATVRERMDVIGSCGNKLGVVDHVEGNSIKLTKNDSPDGQHHLIPMSWVSSVDDHVHLNKGCGAAKKEWQTA